MNVAEVVFIASAGLTSPTVIFLDILEINQYFNYEKLSSISQLIKVESRDMQNLFKLFNRPTTTVSKLSLLASVISINLLLIFHMHVLFTTIYAWLSTFKFDRSILFSNRYILFEKILTTWKIKLFNLFFYHIL